MSLRDLLAFFGAIKRGASHAGATRKVKPFSQRPLMGPPFNGRTPAEYERDKKNLAAKYVGWRRLKVYEIEPIVAEHDTLYLGCYLQLTTDKVFDFCDGLDAYMLDCMEGKVIA